MTPAKSDLGDLPLPVNPVGWDVRFAPGAPAGLAPLDNLMKRYREGKLVTRADPPADGPSESSFESSWSSMMAMLTDETERKGPCTT
jgi:hypothetical protein